MLLVEASGKAKVREFDVAAAIKQYVVGFDITSTCQHSLACVTWDYAPMNEA